VRVLACVLLAFVCSSSAAAAPRASCPGGKGTIDFLRGTTVHALSLGSCTERARGNASTANPFPGIRTTGARAKTQRIWAHGRLVFSHAENGPVMLRKVSADGKWLFFSIDSYASASIASDGLDLLVVSTRGGPVHHLGPTLVYRDYLTWCSGRLVYAAGPDRIAIHAKRLLVAAPPDWKPKPLWNDPNRSFASPTCEPDGTGVSVLSQPSSVNASFFATRWQLWRVGLDGTHNLVDAPPAGWADEQPTWSPDGNTLAFVRERKGYGRLMIMRQGKVLGPVAQLGYQLGYYGHHDWGLAWAR
jgi:dipeptidyl aminopeptidase/acylaminoacyl peptidase